MTYPSTIFDLGAHRGQNISYYSTRASRIVAVEANPALVNEMRLEYSELCDAGRLVIIHGAIKPESKSGTTRFWLHKEFSVLSTVNKPDDASNYREVEVPSIDLQELLLEFTIGELRYVKIDLEGADFPTLEMVLGATTKPTFISVEAHTSQAAEKLLADSAYGAYAWVEGASVGRRTPFRRFDLGQGKFPRHSAGPFGTDLTHGWMNQESASQYLSALGPGWRDLHASQLRLNHEVVAPNWLCRSHARWCLAAERLGDFWTW